MGKHLRSVLPILLSTILLASCATSRKPIPIHVVPEQTSVRDADLEYGRKVFDALRSQYPVETDIDMNERVRSVVDRLSSQGEASKFPWYVYVLKDDNFLNAAATRGNYIFIWTGMLKSTPNDDELATVVAHELSHVLADHTRRTPTEEINSIIGQVAGSMTKQILIADGVVGAVASIAGVALQQGYNAFFVNPESQRKEIEADRIGLLLMAKSGIDPERAIDFWSRSSNKSSKAANTAAFLSSHPSSQERLKALAKHLPRAKDLYRRKLNGETFEDKEVITESLEFDSKAKVWIVEETVISVFDSPSNTGDSIGKLKKLTNVQVLKEHHRWLEIDKPIKGYVESKYLSPGRN